MSNTSTNRLRFNGQESLAEIGSGVLDFDTRLYDAPIGRFGNVDALPDLSRRWSPYVFGYDNPLRFVDPDGMAGEDVLYSDGYSTLQRSQTSGAVDLNGVGSGKYQADRV